MQVINDQENDGSGVNPLIKSTFDLLKRGEQEIHLYDKYKDIVLVMGNIGAGKTAFTQWIAGDNNKLIAKEVVEGTGEFIIEDDNRICNSTVKFKTIFPELEIDAKTKTAYYDCPGFSNTLSTSNDITATYFIKKVLDHAERVKLIFTINYPSVRRGVDPQDFMKLMRHAIDLIKDIDKFKNSIAIVVTKVDNSYVKIGTNFSFVGDNKIILAAANFLNEVKQDMEDRSKASNISHNEQKFYGSAIKFIDAMLVKDGDYFSNIGIFRRPDEPGALSNSTLLQEGKERIGKILHENLNFTKKVSEDFGYTISEKSKNDINDLVEEINTNIWSYVSSISENVLKYYHDLVEQMCDKIKSFVTSATIVDAQQLEAQTFLSKFNQGYNITSNLAEELRISTNPVDLAAKFNNYVSNLDDSMLSKNIIDLEKLGKCFNLLQVVSDKALKTRPLADLFNSMLTQFSKLREIMDNDVIDTAQKINKHLNDTAEIIYRHYHKKMKSLEIQQLSVELREEHDVMLTMIKEIKSAVTLQELQKTVQSIQGNVNRLGISIAKKNIPIIINLEHFLNFLQVVSDKKLITEKLTWICPLEDAIAFLNKSEKWYEFLRSLYSKFSDYEIQKDRDMYDVAYLEDWGAEGKLQGIEINQNNFHNFLSKIAKFNVAEYDSIKNYMVTELQLEELNQVLKLTLKDRINITCIEPSIYIKGNQIRVDTVTSLFRLTNNMDVDVDDSCKNLTVLKSERFNSIKVFALNTLFIDSSVPSVRNNITLTLIAPKWEVVGNQLISLDGLEGESYRNSTMQKNKDLWVPVVSRSSKAKDGACPGAKGVDGKPGGTGGPGGFFFGIGERFVNGESLTITADGGIGGSGQDGGDGYKGTYGVSPVIQTVSAISCEQSLCDEEIRKKIGGFYCKKNYCYVQSLKHECGFKIFGKPGEKGGGGGHGGKGGKGGNPGNSVLFEISSKSKITKHVDVGKDGQNGKDGVGGISNDDHYQDIVVKCKYEWWFGKNYNDWYLLETISKTRDSTVPRCINTNDVDKATEKPKLVITYEEFDKAKIINEYKSYLRENLNNRFTNFFLIEFFKKLENNQDIKAVYNTLGLVDELQGLEEHFHKISKDINLLPFYQSLLDRISEYAHDPKEVGDLNQYRKVLSYLYTSTLSRIYNLQDNFESNLIANVSLYLNVVQEDINKLKDLKEAKNKLDIITKYKQDYKSKIDLKIKEAKHLILEEITPEIDGISIEIDNKIESLINEVTALQEKTKEEQKWLNERKQQLTAELLLQGLFSPFKVLGRVLGFLGPVGEIAGSVIEIGSTAAESFVLDGEHSIMQSAGIVSDLEILQRQIKTFQDQKVTRLKNALENLSQEIDKNSEKLGNLSIKVDDIKIKLSKMDESRYNFKEIQAFERELKSTLQTKEDELRKTLSITNSKTTNALMVIDFCKKAIQLPSVMHDTYNKYRSNQAQLDTLNKAIDSNEQQFQELKEFEEAIYSTIAPILQNVRNDLYRIANHLDTESKVALDITKWKVQSTLREVEFKMGEIPNIFYAKDSLKHCLIKLKDAMTILINSYNHIQDYQENQNFANYVANVCSITANDIDIIVNPELGTALKSAITDLEITIKSSIVLQRYRVAIDAFKQFVFPFAHIYLKGLVLPSHLEFITADKKNIPLDILVYEAATQISEIKSKLEQYKGSLTERDGAIGVGEFNSLYVSSQPFFVWENSQYSSEISRLLSGQEVVLKADIISSLPVEDAIKFNSIELNFESKNETAQVEINNILKGFKISMTHLGNSYYRYNGKIYQITTNSQDFWYYFEKSTNSEPVRRSISYDKLKNLDFILSPYALWKVRLIDIKMNKNNITLKDLEIYKEEINLELAGKGYFVNKGGIKEDLLMERYYKAIDKHGPNLDENNEKLQTVSMLRDNMSPRNIREVNQKSEDQDVEIAAQVHQVSLANQAKKENENSNSKSSSWFSWIRFPRFNLLPGADAAVTEGRKASPKKHLNLDSITVPFRRSLNGAVLSEIQTLTGYTANSNSIERMSDTREDTSSLADIANYSFDGGKTNNIQARPTLDINGNLTLGQLVAYMMFGNNKSFSSNHYISPEQKQLIKIEELAAEIVPIVKCKFFKNGFVDNYKNVPQWYQDMYKD